MDTTRKLKFKVYIGHRMNIDKELDKCETMEDLTGKNGLLQKLIGGMVEKMLEKEMEEHLGYEKHSSKVNKLRE